MMAVINNNKSAVNPSLFRSGFWLPDMPDHLSRHLLTPDRTKIAAVGTVDLGAAHLKCAATIDYLAHTFDHL